MTDNTRIGATVAGYRIQSLIGRGGMSIVYLAEHVQLGRQVALKLLAPGLSADPEFRERFVHESRRAAEVDHPNVVPIFDAGEADGQLFIAMRYIEGCDLKTLIRRDGSLGVGRTLFILEQAADGLDAAHDRNLIHRDVKPANILIAEPSERVYLTDFGVVKHTAAQGLTRTGFFLGTVDYAAPEQIEGLPVDARTDVYALGCVLYECLVGQAPFVRDGELAVLHAHLVQPPPVLSSALQVPKGLDAVIARALAKAKDDRYPTCGELIAAARQAALARRSTHVPVVVAGAAAVAVAGSEPTEDARELAPAAAESGRPSDAAVPPAAPPPPVTPPPPAEPPERGGRRGGLSLPLIVGIAVVAALASGLATYFATRNSGASPARSTTSATATTAVTPTTASTATSTTSTTSTTATTSTTGTGAFTGPAAALVAMFSDRAIARTCVKSPHPGGRATLNCTSTTLDGQLVRLHVDLFGSHSFVKKNYNDDALGPYRAAGGALDAGACTATTWSGEGRWERGRRACFVAKNTVEGCKGLGAAECSIVYWYDEPSHVAVRATVAGAQARSAPQLSVWWDRHKGDFGG
ncbi:MAG TPA: serine/threonine-protein kinase [Gaiellales bacterium]|nr:serine/threonine-protein kinase [Gaiellales bacterium]